MGIVLTTTSPIDTVVSSMVTSFTSQVSDLTTGIGSILPVLLPIIGVTTAIFLGMKLYKMITHK